ALEALTAFEVAVRRGSATLAGTQTVVVHGQAHGAARLAPVETGLDEDLVQTLGLGLSLHDTRARNDHRIDALVDLASLRNLGSGAQVFDATVGAGADEDA